MKISVKNNFEEEGGSQFQLPETRDVAETKSGARGPAITQVLHYLYGHSFVTTLISLIYR